MINNSSVYILHINFHHFILYYKFSFIEKKILLIFFLINHKYNEYNKNKSSVKCSNQKRYEINKMNVITITNKYIQLQYLYFFFNRKIWYERFPSDDHRII